MTPLKKIKSDGEGSELADAIESMAEKLGSHRIGRIWGGELLP